MKDFSFNTWVEARKDIFGFERDVGYQKPDPKDDKPINQFNIDLLMYRLSHYDIGAREPHRKFVNECQWGDDTGSLRTKIHPDLHVEIARKTVDFNGHNVWVTKRLWLINREGYGGNEDAVSQRLLDELQKIDKTPVDCVNRNFELDELEHIVISMANQMRRVARDYFIFEGIKKMNDTQYIISFGLRGQGVEAPDHHRVIQNQTTISYDENTGKIRVTNNNIETPVGGHNWEIMPSDLDINFLPTQSIDEMNEVLATTMRWY